MKNGSLRISGVKFLNPLMNGAYIGSKTLADISKLSKSASGAVVVGSVSIKPRIKNKGQAYWRHRDGFYTLNSYGLPNGGLPYFTKYLPQMVRAAHDEGKPLIANVVGFSKEEFASLVKFAAESGVDIIELNFGCPNAWGKDGVQKRIISYHASLVEDMLGYIKKNAPRAKLWVKISPLPPDILSEVANKIVKSGIVQAVTATNSYPNSSPTTGTGGLFKGDQTLAGLAGRALKPISVGVVKQLRQLLPRGIDIIGCGGVITLNDVNDYLTAGASAVQIASALVDDGLSVFGNILK